MSLTGVGSRSVLQQLYRLQVEVALERKLLGRQSYWTESIVVGNAEYVEALQKQLGIKTKGREITPVEGAWQLRETETAYRGRFEGQKGGLSPENTFYWDRSLHPTMC